MAIELATAYVSILPSTSKLAAGIKSELNTVDAHARSVGDKAGKTLGGRMAAGVKSLVGPALGAVAGAGAISFFKGAFEEATEAQKVGAQTEAVIKSTGGAAKVSAKHVSDLAGAISAKTGIDDEQIQSSQNMLLTFTNIRNGVGKNSKIFDQATRTVTDMSAALGQDGKSSAIQLGKALNDPVKGITALQRVGVSFTDSQKKQIERMVESGDTMGAQRMILRELNKEFGGSAAAQATAADKAKVAWGNLKETVGSALMPVFNRLADFASKRIIPAISGFVEGIRNGTGAGGRFADIVRNIVDAAKNVYGFLKRNKDVLIGLAAGALAAAAAFKAISIVRALTGWIKGLTVVQIGLNAAMRANPIGIIVTAVGLLVAAFVIAYKKSDTFRRIVDKAWAAIKKAIRTAWDGYIKPALKAFWGFIRNTLWPIIKKLWNNAVKPAFKAIGSAIRTAWNNVIKPALKGLWWFISNVLWPVLKALWNKVVKPVFKAIGAAIKFAWNSVIKPALKLWWAYVSKVLWPIIKALWNKVVKPVFKAIGTAIKVAWDKVIRPALKAFWGFIKNTLWPIIKKLWNSVVKPVFGWIGDKIKTVWGNIIKPALKAFWDFIKNTLWPIIKKLWNNVVKPVFTWIGEKVKAVWNNVIKPALKALWGYIKNTLWPTIKNLWNNVVKPVFGWIGDKIRTVWNKVIKPVFTALKNFIKDTLVPAFKNGIEKIGDIWEKLKGWAAKPVNFVIEWVYNKGIRQVIGAIPGVDKPGYVKPIKFAKGGVLPGYTPGRDPHMFYSPTGGRLALSGGEGIMRPEWVRAVGGEAAVARMNKAAAAGRLRRAGDVGAFAKGGVLSEQAIMRAHRWAYKQRGKPYGWGAVGPGSYDCCVPAYTLVSGPDGPRRIDELKPGDRVWSFVDGRMEAQTVAAQWFSKRQMTYRVRTRNRAVEASANHPFLVLRQQEGERWEIQREDAEWAGSGQRQPYGAKGRLPCAVSTCDALVHARGLCVKHHKRLRVSGDPLVYHVHHDAIWGLEWVRLDGLRRGDQVVIESGEPETGSTVTFEDGTEVTEDRAWLVGALTGNGHLTTDSVLLADPPGEVRDRAERVFKEWTGKDRIYSNHSTLIVNSRPLRRVLEWMGLRVLAPEKRVPADVWTWPARLQRAFLEGFCDTDGHRPKRNPERYGQRVYRSASRQLLSEVRLLHIGHGDRVGNLGIVDHRRSQIVIAGNPPVADPKPLWSFTVYPDDQQYANPRIARRAGVREAVESWGGRFTVQPVLAIDPLEETDTYDIEVEGAHNFVADGVVVHNSGFMSALTNVLRGRYPHTRVGATATFPWGGFVSGPGQFTIGSNKRYPGSGVGHMAGTLETVNYESRGGRGVVIGGGARGWRDSGFNQHAHLGAAGAGGLSKFLDAIKKVKEFVGNIRGWLGKLTNMGAWGDLMRKMLPGLLGKLKDWINEKIPGPGPFPDIFDRGGTLQPGQLAFNASRRPEAVFTRQQLHSLLERPRRVEVVITNWQKGVGYLREVADDTYLGHAAHRGGLARMRG